MNFVFKIQKYNKDAKVLRLKMKWSTLYIPDLNNVFAVPCATASYKLLDRVVVVRSGYPVSEIHFLVLILNFIKKKQTFILCI